MYAIRSYYALFLDEIGILSPSAQGKLLRVLQEGEVDRLGSSAPIKVDVRVIVITSYSIHYTKLYECRSRTGT